MSFARDVRCVVSVWLVARLHIDLCRLAGSLCR
ncbi:putative leader peptide [Thermostaphylospora chromogena]